MEVIRTRLFQGAREARGVVVIIDVFRAFSCAPFLFHYGAQEVILEADPEKAVALRSNHSDWILMGEVNEVPIQGGDLSNSPSEILQKGEGFFQGKTVVHRTTAGVTGVAAALVGAQEVLLGSLLTARATVRYVQNQGLDRVTLVAMGSRGERPAPEDEACAEYLEHLLTGRSHSPVAALRDILFQATARKFLYRERPYLPPEDPALCLQRDLFDCVLAAEQDKARGVVVVRRR